MNHLHQLPLMQSKGMRFLPSPLVANLKSAFHVHCPSFFPLSFLLILPTHKTRNNVLMGNSSSKCLTVFASLNSAMVLAAEQCTFCFLCMNNVSRQAGACLDGGAGGARHTLPPPPKKKLSPSPVVVWLAFQRPPPPPHTHRARSCMV